MAATLRDPHFKAILTALADLDLHTNDFEACVCELLAAHYPRLVPVTGGQDSGFDGAIGDLEGEAYPLIATTGRDVASNLEKNLKSYQEGGGTRTWAVFATSRRLTPPQRKKLKSTASNLGITLVQVYDQRAIAVLLYRNSGWCQQLLGIGSKAPVLSALPPMQRGEFQDLPLLGRDEDLDWLKTTPGDRILIAPSGFGKTYLLYWLAVHEGRGLFIATRDRNELAAAIRDQQPDLLFLDDNGFEPEWLQQVLALRRELRPFDLVITGWPSQEDRLCTLLGPKAVRRKLEGLRRRDILGILQHLGVPDHWQMQLADQAMNRPGFAVTLAQLARSQTWRDAVDGNAVLRELKQPVERLLGEQGQEAIQLLSILALGGDAGLERSTAARLLGISDQAAARMLQKVDSIGILVETSRPAEPLGLAVEPEHLRAALVDMTFFAGGAGALDVKPCLAAIGGLEPLKLLLLVTARGSNVDRCLLLNELEQRCPISSIKHMEPEDDLHLFSEPKPVLEVWRGFASLGEQESAWVLERCPPNAIGDMAYALLERLPEATLTRLFDIEVEVGGKTGIKAIRSWSAGSIGNKRQLLDVLERRAQGSALSPLEIEACFAAINPSSAGSDLGPSRDVVRSNFGSILAADSWESLSDLLRRALDLLLAQPEPFPWNDLGLAFNDYRWPEPRTVEFQRRGFKLVHYALVHLRERARQTVPQRFAWISLARFYKLDSAAIAEMQAGYEDGLAELELIFPDASNGIPKNWLERWGHEGPDSVLARWQGLVPQTREFLGQGPANLGWIAHELASRISDPLPWLRLFVRFGVQEGALKPLLQKLSEMDLAAAASLFLNSDYHWGVALEITRRGRPEDLLDSSLIELKGNLARLRDELLRDAELAQTFAERYLSVSPDLTWIIASTISRLHSKLDPDLLCKARQFLLVQPAIPQLPIALWTAVCYDLAANPELAVDWLIALSQSAGSPLPEDPALAGDALRQLIHKLPQPAMARILREADLTFLEKFADCLVGKDPELYLLLIDRRVSPKALALPLEGIRPGPKWIPFAEAAQAAGLAATNIARQAILHGMWGGSPAEIQTWMAALRDIENELPQLAEVAREGLKMAETRLAEALEIQKRIEMRGLVAGG